MFLSSVYCETIKEDFLKTRNYGVRGFPTLILEFKGQQIPICNGFATYQEMSDRIEQATKFSNKNNGNKKINIFFGLLSF